MPVHYPSSFFNTQYLGGGTIRLTSWRQAIVPQNTPPYGLNFDRQVGLTSNVSKINGGAVYSTYVLSKNPSVVYLQLFNQNTLPVIGATPAQSYTINAGSVANPTEVILGTDFFGPNGIAFTSGITWGLSTGETVFYGLSTAIYHTVQINYA